MNMSTFTNSYLDFGWGKADRFSDKVPNYVLEHYPDQRVYNRYVLGTYLIWNWWPDKKVFIDGKSLAYKADFIGEMIPNSHTEIADDQDLSLIIVPIIRTQPYRNLIPNPDWHVVGYDRGMMVFARAGTGSERQAKQSARDLMLYSDEEFQALPRDTRYLLKGVEGFIDFYHNKEDAQGDFSSPFERYDRHIKQLRQTINIPENMDIIRDS